VTIDTLRADHVHCYGYGPIQTPALDTLAKDGVRFAQAFTPSPITNTSHASILTGLLPSTHGVTDFAVRLANTYPDWAELLKKQGYRTSAFIGSVVLDSKDFAPGLDRGFDFYDNFPKVAHSKSRWGRLERRGRDVAQRAETWLSAHPAGPHFVWVHFYDPHDPYDPPPPFSQVYKDCLYDGEIAYVDSALADFLAYLKKKGWYENSIVIVVGDSRRAPKHTYVLEVGQRGQLAADEVIAGYERREVERSKLAKRFESEFRQVREQYLGESSERPGFARALCAGC